MGNSLLDISVFGRIAGKKAAQYVRSEFEDAALTLDHVRAYNQEVDEKGAGQNRISPMLLPDYVSKKVKDKRLRKRID